MGVFMPKNADKEYSAYVDEQLIAEYSKPLKITEYLIVRPLELADEIQELKKSEVFDRIIAEYSEELLMRFGSDPYDMGRPNADEIKPAVLAALEKAWEKAWGELELKISL